MVIEVPIPEDVKHGLEVNMWNSWAIYVSIAMLILLGVGILWGYRKDKRDQINYSALKNDKNKLYIGVYLDPIIVARKDDK